LRLLVLWHNVLGLHPVADPIAGWRTLDAMSAKAERLEGPRKGHGGIDSHGVRMFGEYFPALPHFIIQSGKTICDASALIG
jgi:hypothetical protein